MANKGIIHITNEGDRWDMLAWRYYGEATGYERIIAANPHVPIRPVLPSGLRLVIPMIQAAKVSATGSLPPWMQGGNNP